MTFITNTSSTISEKNSGTLNTVEYSMAIGQIVSATYTTLELSSADSSDDFYNNHIIEILKDSGKKVYKQITDYVGSTKIATIYPPFGEILDSTYNYTIHINSNTVPLQSQQNRSSTLKLNTDASSINNFYKGQFIKLIHNYTNIECKRIQEYDGTTKILTICSQWNELPLDCDSDYYIIYGESGLPTEVTSTTITLNNPSAFVKTGLIINIISGTGIGSSRTITNVTGSVATVNSSWTISTDSFYTIFSGFVGLYEDISNYVDIVYNLKIGSKQNAIVVAELSQDTASTSSNFKLISTYSESITQSVVASTKYFRILVIGEGTAINGSIQTTFGFNNFKNNISLKDNINEYSDCQLTRSIIAGKSEHSGLYRNISTDHDGYLNVNIMQPRDVFGHVTVSEPKVILEMKFPYVTSHLQFDTYVKGSGYFLPVNGILRAVTGTTTNSVSHLQSLRRSYYTGGLALRVRFSAIFSAPAEGCTQLIGYGDRNNGFFFGYNGLNFGILRRYSGKFEIRVLTVTAGASTTGSVAIELDSTSFNVSVTENDSVYVIARKIAKTVFTDWRAYENNNKVIFISRTSTPRSGSYSVSGQSVTGTFAQSQAGIAPTNEWALQSSWNIDRLDESVSLPYIDFTKGNNFEIDIQWLGFGNTSFYIENPLNGKYVPVHNINYPNKYTTTNIEVPHQPMYLEASNGATTSSVYVATSCMTSFIFGIPNLYNGIRFGTSAIKKQSLTVGKKYNIISMRNSPVFMNMINVTEIMGLSINSSWKDATHAGIFRTVVNCDLNNDSSVTWVPRKYGASVVDVCTDFVEITGGEEQVSISMGINNNFFESFNTMEIFMPPGYTLTLAIEAVDNTTDSEFSSGFYWTEKL